MYIPKSILVIVGLVLLGSLLWGTYAIGKTNGRQDGTVSLQAELAAANIRVTRLDNEANECSIALSQVYKGDPDAIARALGATITPAK